MTRKVTENDLRCPEFRDVSPEDYEFRADGKIVRKDRWEQGIRSIVSILEMSRDEFEIGDVVERIRDMERRLKTYETTLVEVEEE